MEKQEEKKEKRWLTVDGKDPEKRKFWYKIGNLIIKDKPPKVKDGWII